jgi:hypothetical protein
MDLRLGDIPDGPIDPVDSVGTIPAEEMVRRVIMRPADGNYI